MDIYQNMLTLIITRIDSELNTARGRISTNETNISSNDTELDAVRVRISTNEINIASNDSDITRIDGELNTARGRITTNETDITTNEGNISTNTTNIATNAANITNNDNDIATNVTNIATNATNIATNAANITNNDNDIATNVTNIATNATNIATNAANITNNDNDIATNVTNIATNAANITSNDTDIALNRTNILTNSNAITTNQNNIANNTSDIGVNTTAIATNMAAILTNGSAIASNDADIARIDGELTRFDSEDTIRDWIESEIADEVKIYAQDGQRAIAAGDLDSDLESRLLAPLPVQPEIQKIGYSGIRANTFSPNFGRPEITRITIPHTFNAGRSTGITSTDTGVNYGTVTPTLFTVNPAGLATGYFVVDAIVSNGESGTTGVTSRQITAVNGQTIFTVTAPGETDSDTWTLLTQRIWVTTTNVATSVEINFDDSDVESEITGTISVTFGDSEGPEDALNRLKDAIESDDSDYTVSDPDSDSDGIYIQVDTGIENNTSTSIDVTDDNGTDVNFSLTTIQEGRRDQIQSLLTVTTPSGVMPLNNFSISNQLAIDDLILLILGFIGPEVESPVDYDKTDDSTNNDLVFTGTTNEPEVTGNVWEITIDHGTYGDGDIVFEGAIVTQVGSAEGRLARVDSEIVFIIGTEIEDWAHKNNTDLIPSSKLPESDIRDWIESEVNSVDKGLFAEGSVFKFPNEDSEVASIEEYEVRYLNGDSDISWKQSIDGGPESDIIPTSSLFAGTAEVQSIGVDVNDIAVENSDDGTTWPTISITTPSGMVRDVVLSRPAGDPDKTTTILSSNATLLQDLIVFEGRATFIDDSDHNRFGIYRPLGFNDGDGPFFPNVQAFDSAVWDPNFGTGGLTVGRRYSVMADRDAFGSTDPAAVSIATALWPLHSYIDFTLTDNDGQILNFSGIVTGDFQEQTYGTEHVIAGLVRIISADAIPSGFGNTGGSVEWTCYRGQWVLDVDDIVDAIVAENYTGFSKAIATNSSNTVLFTANNVGVVANDFSVTVDLGNSGTTTTNLSDLSFAINASVFHVDGVDATVGTAGLTPSGTNDRIITVEDAAMTGDTLEIIGTDNNNDSFSTFFIKDINIANWAEEGDSDQIPLNKLGNVPAVSLIHLDSESTIRMWIESEIDSDFYSKAEVDRKDSELAARFDSETTIRLLD